MRIFRNAIIRRRYQKRRLTIPKHHYDMILIFRMLYHSNFTLDLFRSQIDQVHMGKLREDSYLHTFKFELFDLLVCTGRLHTFNIFYRGVYYVCQYDKLGLRVCSNSAYQLFIRAIGSARDRLAGGLLAFKGVLRKGRRMLSVESCDPTFPLVC